MKKSIKILIDVTMTILFMIQMAYHITGNALHEWLGMLLFGLFVLHHLLNLRWHQNLFKGKYPPIRVLMLTLDAALFVSMLGMMISGIMLSREVFGFLHLRAGMFGRRLHMVSTAWGYLLMAAHIGLHWGQVVAAMRRRTAGRIPKWLPTAAAAVLSAYGVIAFYRRGLWRYLFLLVEYAFFDYGERPILFFADYAAILILFAALGYYGVKLLRKSERRS